MSENDERRNFRRKTEDGLGDVNHSQKKSITISGSKYEKKIGMQTTKMVKQMLDKDSTKNIAQTQEDALAIYQEALNEAADIDRQIVRNMLDKSTAPATRNIDPKIVNLAMGNAISHFIKDGGILDDQKKRIDITPNQLSATKVRMDADSILKKTKFRVEHFNFKSDANISDEDRYEHVAPLATPVELKNIAIILPRDTSLMKEDLQDLHLRMLTDLPPGDKPDAISLAQTYIKYRRSLISATRQIL